MPMGYQGYAKVSTGGDATTDYLILGTCDLSQSIELMPQSGVWGAGWYNASDSHHYSDGNLTYSGSISTELHATTTFWNLVRGWAIEQRAYSRSVSLSPDGVKIYSFISNQTPGDPNTFDNTGVWCDGADFGASPGGNISCSMNVKALYKTFSDTGEGGYLDNRGGVTTGAVFAVTTPLNPDSNNISPIPYWKSNAELLRGTYPQTVAPQTDLEVTDWQANVANNSTELYTCSGSRAARAVLMGPISSGGSITLYHPLTVFDPILGGEAIHGVVGTGTEDVPFLNANNTRFLVTITTTGASTVTIELPAVVINSDDGVATKDSSSVTTRALGIEGYGGRVYGGSVLPPCIMSEAT